MNARLTLAATLLFASAACSDDVPFLPFDGDAFVADAGSDAGSDAVGADAASDAGQDATADGGPDGETDTVADTTTDTAVDTTPDAIEIPGILDPGCVDGQFSETLPDPSGDISDLVAGYTEAGVLSFIVDVLDRRYPTGAYLINEGLADTSFIDCVDFFLGDTATAADVIEQLSTLVHECGHVADVADRRNDQYIINEELRFVCAPGGDTVDRGGQTFARSLLNTDAYTQLRQPCSVNGDDGCDFYADVYLTGDPFDGTFDGGDQGFNSVMEEAVQYVNSLATGYAFADQFRFTISERDGILTFLWYIERYLYLARTEYPDAYDYILGSECYRDVILTTWGRGWQYLELTENIGNLGIDDDELEALVRDPVLLEEIESVREAEGCE